jgi:hypothetical protein
MKIKEAKLNQQKRLTEICKQKKIDSNSMINLLESVKTKKLYKRNNFHQQKISDIIEKEIKQ